MLMKNVDYLRRVKKTVWRKIAVNAWDQPNYSTIYSRVELGLENVNRYLKDYNSAHLTQVTLTDFVGKVCGKILEENNLLNCSVVGREIYERKNIDVFFHISFNDRHGENLTGLVIEKINIKTLKEISREIKRKVIAVQRGTDSNFNSIKKSLDWIPELFIPAVLKLLTFFQYRLNLWSKFLGTSRDSFGSIMVSNVGTFDVEEAFVPFANFTHTFAICSIGKPQKKATVSENQIVIQEMVTLCWTLDHRIVDGSSAGKMLQSLKNYFHHPELL